jgi:HSP20 family protein
MTANKGLTTVEPRTFMRRMLRDVDRFLEEGRFPFRAFGDFVWVPELEVVERDHQLRIRLDLPGLKMEEISVTVTDEGLILEGERTAEAEETKNEWYRTERTYGRFVRTVPLPGGVKASDIKAAFTNGVLEVTVPLPARAAATMPHKVEIAVNEEKKAVKAAA